VDADETREPRTLEDMEQEAKWLASFFDADE
jgi:bis(5'-adenosyl)-triphosphatase